MNSNLDSPIDPEKKLFKNVKGLMFWRVFILTLLLVIAYIFQLSERKYFFIATTYQFYYFIGLFYFVTIGYAFLLKRVKDLRRFTIVQLVMDHLFIAGLIYYSGGKESFFPIVYIFSIIGCSMLFYKRGAFYSASLSTFLYGLILLMQLYKWVYPPGQPVTPDASQVFYSLVTYLSTFYIVAFLSSMVSEELKKKKTELVQKQIDYDQLEAFNRNIVQSLDSGLLTIDLNGRINFLNRNAEKTLGLKGTQLKDSSIEQLFPEISRVVDELKQKPHLLTHYKRYEMTHPSPARGKIYLGLSISPLTDMEDALIGHTLIFQDITRYKEMEEQMKRYDRMAAVGTLAAGMAHEIRNPLASLSGAIQMLKSELTLNTQQSQLMEITLRESERLNALINDFLLFAHPPQAHRSLWELRKILDETIQLFMHSPDFHEGLHIVWDRSNGEIQSLIDPDQMRQVFWNLLINAAHAISDGGEIRVSIEKINSAAGENLPFDLSKREGEWVKVVIADSGNGIPPQEKEKIFEPFYTTKERGTGLGLSIAHKIIENHQGGIKVESDIGRGTTFTVFLPIAEERSPNR